MRSRPIVAIAVVVLVALVACTPPTAPPTSGVPPTSASPINPPSTDTGSATSATPPAPDAGWPATPTQLDTSPTGDVLTFFPGSGVHGEVAMVAPDGSTRVLYELPAIVNPWAEPGPVYDWPPNAYVATGHIDGQWAVFDIAIAESFHAGSQMIVQLVAVNLSSGATQTVRPLLPADQLTTLSISKWVVLDGAVYWSETSGNGVLDMIYFYTGPSSIYRYELATKQQTTLAAKVQLTRADAPFVDDPSIVNGRVGWVTSDGVQHWYGD